MAFTAGIEGTGLHGALMVLDPSFTATRLIKLLRLPPTLPAAAFLNDRLQALIRPAR
ncbi:unnamed protein product [Protopolystoma xenopodis]|uniref:Uncharacterized protein n=1 Tax=Protopolystoma xenopodis TaxID=117903 RepID=A0A3S5A826_9PLAT|nr:unnamed protein product [Protopolystoma xenopodis]